MRKHEAQIRLDFLVAISVLSLVLIFTVSALQDFRGSLPSSPSEDFQNEARRISKLLALSDEWSVSPFILNFSKLEMLHGIEYEEGKELLGTSRDVHIIFVSSNGSLRKEIFGRPPDEISEFGEWKVSARILNESIFELHDSSSLSLSLAHPDEVVVEISPLCPKPLRGNRTISVNGETVSTTEECTFVLKDPENLEIQVIVQKDSPEIIYLTELRIREYYNGILVVRVW
ncbi:MAG: hypothetical protein PWR13_1414 [Archaeoglobi archaeon]|nr:hypothetical protein [Archaeoglobi archaeon]